MVAGKSVLLGITGSVAAYKAIDLIKRLKQQGASVRVIMTDASMQFITPLSIEIASAEKVYCDMFESPLSHISLAAGADMFVIAPATANIIGKYANGIADDLLSTALLAFNGPPGRVIIAPAMNWRMFEHPALQKNLMSLISAGVKTVGPSRGNLACGEEGIGKMADIEEIMEAIQSGFTKQDLKGEKVLVTAGPTREYIDPVRFICNRSSGKMGYAIARIAKRRGADVSLISGHVSINPPYGVNLINAETASDMHKAVMDNIKNTSILIMAAAVADFAPACPESSKIEKSEKLSLNLIKTSDILKDVGALKDRPFTAGFSAETGSGIDRARRKMRDKKIDMIVFNDVTKAGSGFDVDTNEVVIIDTKREKTLPLLTKEGVAEALFDRIAELRNPS